MESEGERQGGEECTLGFASPIRSLMADDEGKTAAVHIQKPLFFVAHFFSISHDLENKNPTL